MVYLYSTPVCSVMSFQEWLSGLALVQSEEADRISKFVFRKDAKLAMVLECGDVCLCMQ